MTKVAEDVIKENLNNLYDLGARHKTEQVASIIERELKAKKFGVNKEFDAGFDKALEIILEKLK